MVSPSASRGSITRPAHGRHRYRRDEPGAQVEVVERDERLIELHPLLAPGADQAWFWTKRWQEMESAAEEDIAAGRVATFESAEEYAADLEREAAERGLA